MVMKQYAENGKLGLCHSLRSDEIYKHVYSGGYPYIDGGLIVQSTSSRPIYSYGKNYEKSGQKFAFFIWTTDDNQSHIEQLFDSALERVTDEQLAQVVSAGTYIYL